MFLERKCFISKITPLCSCRESREYLLLTLDDSSEADQVGSSLT